jgi:hypothetical protein
MANDYVKDLSDAIRGLLSRFANEKGVSVKYHKTEPRMKFSLMTTDKMVIEVNYDINRTSKEYIDGMLLNVMTTLNKRRKERQESVIIIA